MNLRKRIRKSKTLEGFLSSVLAGYVRLCLATGKWQANGLDDLERALKDGPVILVMWHGRLMLSGPHWPKQWCRIKPIHDTAPAGRLAGATMRKFGLEPIAVSSKKSNITVTRAVLREISNGLSVGLAVDGPEGPARKSKPAPIGWARATSCPVFAYAWSSRRAFRLGSWDRLLMPVPFASGTYTFKRWDMDVPRGLDAQAYEKLTENLGQFLDQVSEETDETAGLSPDS